MKFRFLALLALVLGLASCQKDTYGLDVDANGEAAVTISVALPDVETRAGGEDSAIGAFGNVNFSQYDVRYILEVYNLDGTLEGELAKERLVNYENEAKETSFTLRLIPGRGYRFVVWADLVLEDTEDDLHYKTENLKDIQLTNGLWKLSDETRDAYTGFSDEETFTSASNIRIELKRPLGKLRVVTTDIKDMFNVLPEEVTVLYTSDIYTRFNAFTSQVVSDSKFQVVNPKTIKISENKYTNEWNTEGKVKENLTLFTDYYFAANEQEPISFTLDVEDNNGMDIPQVVFSTPIPIQRNYLTTVMGPVLTDANSITVVVNDAFANLPQDDPGKWNPEDDKYDVEVISGPYTETITLKTGNYFFKNVTVTTTTGPAIQIEENAVVTIDVQGILKLVGATDGIAVPNSSKLTINGISETRAEGKFGNLNVVAKGGYGIGGIGADVTIKNTTIDYICGWPVQPLFEQDLSYGKSEPEGFSAIGGAKITLDNVEIKKAEGGSKAAAIGNRYWQSTEINITNSILGDVFGGNASAAIGGSRYSSDATKHSVKINIDGTTIKNAVGGQFAAGIGAGYDTHCSANDSNAVNNIVITNSNITVKGGKYGAGIGTGYHSAALTGSIDAASTIKATAGESREKYTLAQNIGYGVVDATREFKDANVTFEVAGAVIPSPVAYSNIVIVTTIEELQAALDGAKDGDNLIRFGANIAGIATIKQADKKNILLDGCGYEFDGTLYIHGSSRYTGAETLNIANVNFKSDVAKWFIDSNSTAQAERYAHNVTIKNCTFTSEAADNSVAVCGARFRQAYTVTFKDCTATNTFYMAWFTGCSNLTVEDCEVINNEEGITFGPCNKSVIKNSKIEADLYGVRYEATTSYEHNVTIEGCELKSFIPVSVRNIKAGTNKPINVAFSGTNTLTKGGLYDVAFCANEYKSGVAPEIATGEWTISGDENYTVFPKQWIVTNEAELKAAIAAGNDTIRIKGEIDLATIILSGYNGTIIGADDTAAINTRNFTPSANEAYQLRSNNLTFKNIDVKLPTDIDWIQSGFVGTGNIVFDECDFEGQATLNGSATWIFNNCTFVSTESGKYASFVYGATKATFNRCSFSGVERAAKVYGTGGTLNVEYNTCEFTSSSLNKSGVEIDASYATTTVALNECTQTAMAGLFALEGSKGTVLVDGYTWVADGLSKKDGEYYVSNANGLATLNTMMSNKTAGKDTVVNLNADINFAGKTWTPIDSHADQAFSLQELNGNGHTISNLTINGQAMFTRFAGSGDVTVKNITFDNASVNSTAINTSILTVQTYQNVLLDNVDVRNSSINGGYKVAPLIGTVYNESSSTITATLKNCDVENVTVKATTYDFCTTGMVAFVYADDNDTIEFENCTVKDVTLMAPNDIYKAHAAIYTTSSDSLYNEAEGVTVTNVTFEAL